MLPLLISILATGLVQVEIKNYATCNRICCHPVEVQKLIPWQ